MNESCREIEPLLSAYHDRELAPDEARRVEAHVAGCAACARVLDAYATGDALLASAGPRRSEAEWAALAESVDAAIAAEEEAADAAAIRRPVKRWFGLPRPILLGSAASLAVAVVIAVLQPELSQAPAPLPQGAPRANEELAATRDVETLRRDADELPSDERERTLEADALRSDRPAASLFAARPTPPAAPRVEEALRGAPAPPTLAKTTRHPAPDLSPLSPSGGAASMEEVRSAWERLAAGDSAPSEAQPRLNGSSKAAMRTLADAGHGDARGRVSAEGPAPLPDRLLAWARTERDAGRIDVARSALELLTGDFPDNTAREAAWRELLSLDGNPATPEPAPERALRAARSFDAFRLAYPDRDDILGPRAHAWVRAAQLDQEGVCRTARARADEWLDQSRGDDRSRAQAVREALAASCP